MPQINSNFIALSAVDRQLIEEEHARLERFLCDLCDTCSEFMSKVDCHRCDKEKVASCQGRLPSFFYDFHDLVAEHCEHEEKIMYGISQTEELNDYLRLHQEDHARIMQDVKQLIQESTVLIQQGNVAVAIRQFYQLIKDRFGEHARSFDNILLSTSHHCSH